MGLLKETPNGLYLSQGFITVWIMNLGVLKVHHEVILSCHTRRSSMRRRHPGALAEEYLQRLSNHSKHPSLNFKDNTHA